MSEEQTHSIDISAMQRSQQALRIEDETVCLSVKDLHLYYGEKEALKGVGYDYPRKKGNCVYRSIWLW